MILFDLFVSKKKNLRNKNYFYIIYMLTTYYFYMLFLR